MYKLQKLVPDFFGVYKPASSCCEAAIITHSDPMRGDWLACSKCHEELEEENNENN